MIEFLNLSLRTSTLMIFYSLMRNHNQHRKAYKFTAIYPQIFGTQNTSSLLVLIESFTLYELDITKINGVVVTVNQIQLFAPQFSQN